MNILNHKSRFDGLVNAIRVGCNWLGRGWLVLMLVVGLSASFNVSAIAATPATSIDQNRLIALQFAQEGWGTNPNWEKTWDKLVSPKIIYHFNSSAQLIVGLVANKEFNKSLFQGFPDIHQKIEDAIVEGDQVVYRTTIEGTNTGTFLGTPPTGKSIKVNDFTLLRLDNGRIVEMWYETNLLEVMQQMGLVPRAS
jgi:predicted ester cyclase